MDREIKLRAWDERKKKMIFGPTDDNPNASWILALTGMGLPIMQYANLTNKEGIALDWWESDILEDEDGYRFRIDYLGDVGRYGFLALSDLPIENYFFIWEDYPADELKKIGDIYQDPELLTNSGETK